MVLPLLFATVIDLDPDRLVRVEQPNHAEALARSSSGAVLLEPPVDPSVRWSWESVPRVDEWPATEALDAMNVWRWHDEGARGRGVKVAVFDLQWFDGRYPPDTLGEVITHDCWLHPSCELPIDTLRPTFTFERGSHGVACAEIVRDVAPEVELHLVRVNSRTMLENAVDWAIRNDIDVISMSLSFYNVSFFDGSGPIGDLMDELAAHDILMVTSAGNTALGHWQGGYIDADGDGRMDFAGDNGLWLQHREGDDRTYVTWDQYGICGSTDLDVVLYDERGLEVGRSSDVQLPIDPDAGGSCQPIERLSGAAPRDGRYRLEVHHTRGSTTDLLVDVLSPGSAVELAEPRSSIADPGMHPAVFTVGAVDAADYLRADVRPYSSQGPSLTGVGKPDIAGPDGLTTRAYGTRGFTGTSASTPAVVGLIAVVMSDEPGLSPRDAARRLQGWAWGDGLHLQREDPRWGSGKARLPVRGQDGSCGRRPLLLTLWMLPLAWLIRRRRHVT